MQVSYADARLARVETEEAAKTGLPINVILSARRKLVLLRSAPDERTLRNWKSLHYEKLMGDRKDQRSIRLNDAWRLVFKLDENTSPPTIVVLEIVNYH